VLALAQEIPLYSRRRVGVNRTKHRPEALAHAEDVRKLRKLVDEVMDLELQLQGESDVSRKIQAKANIKKKLTSRGFGELLKRLELRGEPVWGLSQTERALVKEARRMVNSC
jgi:hypothetical protein